MSFLKKLFGGGNSGAGDNGAATKVMETEDYKGYTISVLEMRAGGEYQLCGSIEREVDGEIKTHKFIRADRLSSADLAISVTLTKGRQIIDEQGDSLLG